MTYGEYFQIIIIYLPQLNKKQKKSPKSNRFDPELHRLFSLFGRVGFHFHSNRLVSLIYGFTLRN